MVRTTQNFDEKDDSFQIRCARFPKAIIKLRNNIVDKAQRNTEKRNDKHRRIRNKKTKDKTPVARRIPVQ